GSGFADAAFLVEESDDAHGGECTGKSGKTKDERANNEGGAEKCGGARGGRGRGGRGSGRGWCFKSGQGGDGRVFCWSAFGGLKRQVLRKKNPRPEGSRVCFVFAAVTKDSASAKLFLLGFLGGLLCGFLCFCHNIYLLSVE